MRQTNKFRAPGQWKVIVEQSDSKTYCTQTAPLKRISLILI